MAGPKVILFEDKLGVSDGYQGVWNSLTLSAGFMGADFYRRNSYRIFPKMQLLIRQGNRKSPGFNPSAQVQGVLREWVREEINRVKPVLVIMWDPALFFLLNPDWNQATADNMRGGVYNLMGLPCVCTLPIHAWHTKKSEKDIARLNDGFANKDDWMKEQLEEAADESEEDESEDGEAPVERDTDDDDDGVGTTAIWLEPVSVPYGKFVLRKDFEKAKRVMDQYLLMKKEG